MMGHLVYPKGAALIVAASLLPATACCGRHSADEFYGVPPDRFSIEGVVDGSPMTVEDAIGMVRIEDRYGSNDCYVVFSPDGSKFATVVWRGDLERDLNIFSLLVLDVQEALRNPRSVPTPVLSIEFAGDPDDQAATPIDQLTFLADNRSVAFLGTFRGEPKQVYVVDSRNGRVRGLTDHPYGVRAYAMSHDGTLRFFAAAAVDDEDRARVSRFDNDGVFPFDRAVLPERYPHAMAFSVMFGMRPREVRQYFVPSTNRRTSPRLVFDSRQSRRAVPSVWELAADTAPGAVPRGNLASERTLRGISSFSADPRGRYVVLWPYLLGKHSVDHLPHDAWSQMNLYARSLAAYHGLVDLEAGTIAPLLDVLTVPFLTLDGGQVWAPDGSSVLVKTFLPLDSSDPDENVARTREPPAWLEVQIPSREFARVPVPDGWSIVRWDESTDALILHRADSVATMRRESGGWFDLRVVGTVPGFNPRRPLATNGRVVIGVKDSLTVPPDLAAYDLANGTTTVVTDLNPQLRNRAYGEVEQLRFQTPFDTAATAWLAKPVGFQEGRRYPLVVLHKDEGEREWDRSYLIDGQYNLSGHAIQPLAAAGFMVLFIGEPPMLRTVMQTPREGEVVRVNTEEAIRALAKRGYVDTLRVGISGWSRAGYYVDYQLIHSPFPYWAASKIDGGSREYNDRMRPFSDAELGRIRTPLLFQPHGLPGLLTMSSMADRMKAIGKPLDVLYFHAAPHSTKQPRHRWSSLTTHIDWWQFWLQDHEDPDPGNTGRYERWRDLGAVTAEPPRLSGDVAHD